MPKARPIDLSRLNISEYLFNKKARATSTFVYTPERSYYLLDGQEITEQRLESIYPTEIKKIPNVKGDNLDPRSNFY